MSTELDALLDSLAEYQAIRGVASEEDAAASRAALWQQLTAIIDARVVAALRAAGVARRVGTEDEDRRTAHGSDD